MRIADIQSVNPDKIERSLLGLRNRYRTNIMFRSFWDIFVKMGAKIMMKTDAVGLLKEDEKITGVKVKQFDEEFPTGTDHSKCVCNLHTDEVKLKTLIEKNYELTS